MQKRILILFFSSLATILLGGCSDSQPEYEPKLLVEAVDVPEEELLQEAMLNYDQGLYKTAQRVWTALRNSYPSSPYTILAEIKIADCFFFMEDFESAIVAYEEFLRQHPSHEALPYVQFQIAMANYLQNDGAPYDQTPLKNALREFTKLEENFPRSYFNQIADEYRKAGAHTLARHELEVAAFYIRRGREKAAKKRIQDLFSSDAGSRLEEKERSALLDSFKLNFGERTEIARAALSEKSFMPKTPEVLAVHTKQELQASPAFREKPVNYNKLVALTQKRTAPKQTPQNRTYLRCSVQQGLETYEIASDYPLEIVRDEGTGNAREIVLSVKGASDFPAERCALVSSMAEASVSENLLVLRIRHEQKVEPQSFVLDRPHRLATVLQPKS